MKKLITICMSIMMLCMALTPAAFAAETAREATVCYPTAVTRTEDGSEIRKMYDLAPEDDPAGIPRSDFEQDGYLYTLVDLLKQELPEYETRQHTETVSLSSKSKDMASVLELLPQEREIITDDGLTGTLQLQLETVKVEVAGYGSSTKELSAQRTYPNLAGQDTSYIPKTIEDGGNTLTLQSIDWQSIGMTGEDGLERYTAIATYAGSTTNSYVKGYTVTADYTGTVSRIALNRTRYVAIFHGEPIAEEIPPVVEPEPEPDVVPVSFNWAAILVPVGIVALAGAGIGVAILVKHRKEDDGGDEE